MKFYLKRIAAPFVFLLCFSNLGYGSQCDFWINEEEMKPYFRATRYIGKLANLCERLFSPLKDNPKEKLTPIPFILRTPKYLYLETFTHENSEIIQNLHSPFGVIKLLNSSSVDINKSASNTFFHLMQSNWEIKEVTDKVEFYEFNNKNEDNKEELSKPSTKLTFMEKGEVTPHIYLIKNFNDYNFIKEEDINSQALIIYTVVYLGEKQIQAGKALFAKFKSIKELNKS